VRSRRSFRIAIALIIFGALAAAFLHQFGAAIFVSTADRNEIAALVVTDLCADGCKKGDQNSPARFLWIFDEPPTSELLRKLETRGFDLQTLPTGYKTERRDLIWLRNLTTWRPGRASLEAELSTTGGRSAYRYELVHDGAEWAFAESARRAPEGGLTGR
jgi:hypothetical protein